jgi:hypothetical protein
VLKNKEKTIFITIAACREYFLLQTVESALAAAEYPERVFFGIFNTIIDKRFSLLSEDNSIKKGSMLDSDRIFYTEFISPTPMGTGFSRMNASLLSDRDHDFVLQIDAHTIFDKGWDTEMIANHDIAEKYTDSPFVLSNQPHGWVYDAKDKEKIFFASMGPKKILDPLNFNSQTFLSDGTKKDRISAGVTSVVLDGVVGKQKPNKDMVGQAWVESGDPRKLKKIVVDGVNFYEGHCVYAAQLFYSYKHLMTILHYPKDWFYGDQIDYSLRLVSRGFKIFHFDYPVLVALGKLDLNPETESIIDRDPENSWRVFSGNNSMNYANHMSELSEKHHRDIFSGRSFGYWGAPDTKSLIMAKKIMNLDGYLE